MGKWTMFGVVCYFVSVYVDDIQLTLEEYAMIWQ